MEHEPLCSSKSTAGNRLTRSQISADRFRSCDIIGDGSESTRQVVVRVSQHNDRFRRCTQRVAELKIED